MSLKRSWILQVGGVVVVGLATSIALAAELNLYGCRLGADAWLKRSHDYTAPQEWQSIAEALTREASWMVASPDVQQALASPPLGPDARQPAAERLVRLWLRRMPGFPGEGRGRRAPAGPQA